jgi:hypothetical protein
MEPAKTSPIPSQLISVTTIDFVGPLKASVHIYLFARNPFSVVQLASVLFECSHEDVKTLRIDSGHIGEKGGPGRSKRHLVQ